MEQIVSIFQIVFCRLSIVACVFRPIKVSALRALWGLNFMGVRFFYRFDK